MVVLVAVLCQRIGNGYFDYCSCSAVIVSSSFQPWERPLEISRTPFLGQNPSLPKNLAECGISARISVIIYEYPRVNFDPDNVFILKKLYVRRQ